MGWEANALHSLSIRDDETRAESVRKSKVTTDSGEIARKFSPETKRFAVESGAADGLLSPPIIRGVEIDFTAQLRFFLANSDISGAQFRAISEVHY